MCFLCCCSMMMWSTAGLFICGERKNVNVYYINSSYCNAMSIVIDVYFILYSRESTVLLRIITVKIDNLHTFYPVIILITLRTR